ncbi:MAG: hypothetical protein KDD82_25880 [Planctomycetes bacterium]|nr:hypothetical protein [Planctomycetota bacterium]
MSDDAWLNELATELGEAPLRGAELERLRSLARGYPAPWGATRELSPDLALSRVLRREAYLRQTRRRVWLACSMAAALLFCVSPTLVRWRVERPGRPNATMNLNEVGLIFWTSGAR